MRTDLMSIWSVYLWLEKHAPEYLDEFPMHLVEDVPEPVKEIIAALNGPDGFFDAMYMSQTTIARTAIERWNLENVAILGGGRPHPFSPRPDQVKVFTDSNLDVLAEAEHLGYRTLQLDVRNLGDLQKLEPLGVTTIIATGLLHFVPDEGIRFLFDAIAACGARAFVWNCASPAAHPELFEIARNIMRISMYPRTQDQFRKLIPAEWRIIHTQTANEFALTQGPLGQKIAHQPHQLNVFFATL